MNRINDFLIHFKDNKEISNKDIFSYFHEHGKTKDNSIKALISRWTKQGILSRVKKGVYIIVTDERKKLFKIYADDIQKKIAKIFSKKYPELIYSIWNSNSLNSLMTHQYFNSFYVFETESDVLSSSFYLFKEHGMKVFLSPNEELLDRYIIDSKNPIIIQKIISRSPLAKKEGIPHPTIEKILVDIFVDKVLYNFIQGAELINIYNEAFSSYIINLTKLLNYADRRKAKNDITNFIRMEVNNQDIVSLL